MGLNNEGNSHWSADCPGRRPGCSSGSVINELGFGQVTCPLDGSSLIGS